MSICADTIGMNLGRVILAYQELDKKLYFEDDSTHKFMFISNEDLVDTLVACKGIITETLRLHTYLTEDEITNVSYVHTRDMYKRSQIRVTYAIIYHDLKNVFEILDIADSDKSSTITVENIKREDLENIYVAMLSFLLKTIKLYSIRFGVGGAARRGQGKRTAVNEKV